MFCRGLETIQLRRRVFSLREEALREQLWVIFLYKHQDYQFRCYLACYVGVQGTLKKCLGCSISRLTVGLVQAKDTRRPRYQNTFPIPIPITFCAPIIRNRLLLLAWGIGLGGLGVFARSCRLDGVFILRVENTNKGNPNIQRKRRSELLSLVRDGNCAKAVGRIVARMYSTVQLRKAILGRKKATGCLKGQDRILRQQVEAHIDRRVSTACSWPVAG